MKNILLLCFLFCASHTMAQSLDDAFVTAKKQNKLVMIVVKSPKCTQCNEVAEQGLSGSVTLRAIEASAVLVKVDKLPDFLANPFSLYSIPTEFFGVIYMDADKNVLRIYNGSSSFFKTYLDHLEKAIAEKESSTENMASLISDYYGKRGGFQTSMKLISKIMATGLEPKDEVIDELVHTAPPDSAVSLSFLQFVERAAPSIGSAAHQYTVKNVENYNMSWYRMGTQERSQINNRSYQKSMRKAIAEKDVTAVYQLSTTRQSMYRPSGFEAMQRAGQEVFLQYYKGVKDSTNYFMRAPAYYNSFFMTVSVDSVKKVDSAKSASLFRVPPAVPKTAPPPGAVMQTQMVGFSPLAQYYATALNEAAWTYYTWSRNPVQLAKALAWARRAVEFYETPESMDTYARLLYVTNATAAAIEWETRAVAALKAKNRGTADFSKILSAMQKGEIKIDEY